MADLQRPSLVDRDLDQAITALKKGAHLLKYGRRGKPKFCPFRLSSDESTLIWYYGKDEKQLELRHVSRIIPGQRTQIFQRYPRPEKEYQSFSLIYSDRSLDLICKDKDEAEVWFVGLKALIARGNNKKSRNDSRSESTSSGSPSSSSVPQEQGDTNTTQRPENTSSSQSRLGKAFADIVSYTSTKNLQMAKSVLLSSENSQNAPRTSGAAETTFRVSLSSAVSSSSQGSCNEDFNSLGDVFIWGEGTCDGVVGGGLVKSNTAKNDALLPKALESTMVLDIHNIACGKKHAVLVTKQGEIFSWGEEAGGRLGHGVEADVPHPKLIDILGGKSIEMVACGEYHTCAVTLSGELYTWGDGSCNLLGHGTEASHWVPKKVGGPIEGLQVSFVSCGPWHTAFLTSVGQLFTFGDGTFGALGHGDHESASIPREVESLKTSVTLKVACGVWHTAAIVDVTSRTSSDNNNNNPDDNNNNNNNNPGQLTGKLFTWGAGDKGRLGHDDDEPRLAPEPVFSLFNTNFSRVACGAHLTVALSTSGRVYTMGDGKNPTCVGGDLAESCVEEIACGASHVAVLTSKAEVYTWGRGRNGQLGHGDNEDRNIPTLVEFLKDKQIKTVACGSNFTAVICLHKWISSVDNSLCSGCQNLFGFRRKRHNCYNCGLVFCNTCSSKKSLKASLAPTASKPYRVCDDCFGKLQKSQESSSSVPRIPNVKSSGGLLYNRPSSSSDQFTEKDGSGVPRLLGSISRLSSAESFKSERSSTTFDNNRLFPLQNENNIVYNNNSNQRASTSSKSPTSPFGSSPSFLSFTVPDSRIVSRSPSPVPGKSSPMRSARPSMSLRGSEANIDDSLSVEVRSLRAQVERLTSKSQLLEAELERNSKQLKEATARAADEAEKSKAAKEVIMSLTAQLKEMTERVREEQVNEQTSNDSNLLSNTSSLTTSPKSESSDNPNTTSPMLSNGTKAQPQKTERTIQDEPGVYITLISLPSGINELRRVRFSRKCFTEEQAEKWWAENGTRLCERHNIKTVH